MALELIANLNANAPLEDLFRIVLGVNSEVKLRSTTSIEGLTAKDTWVRVLQQSSGKADWDIPRDIFGIEYNSTVYMRLQYESAREEILRIVSVLPDLCLVAPKAGLLRYQDLALARWHDRIVEVDDGGLYSSEIVESFQSSDFSVKTVALPEI